MEDQNKLIQLSERFHLLGIRISHIEQGYVDAYPGELDMLRAEYARVKAEYRALPEISEIIDQFDEIHSTRH